MTDQEQDIAVAKALGHEVFRANGQEGSAWCGGSRVTSAGGAYIKTGEFLHEYPKVRKIPSYGSDLNACHEMEKSLKYPNTGKYDNILREVMKSSGLMAISAPAPQRREAFLRVLGLWV